MKRWVRVSCVLTISAGCVAPAVARDYRLEPSIIRPADAFVIAAHLPGNIGEGPAAVFSRQMAAIPKDYAPAMIWYRAALSQGAAQMTTREPRTDEEATDPLQYVWRAENGDLVSKTGRGMFHLTYGGGGNSWHREVDCRMVAWPDGQATAMMNCSDGVQRAMVVPSAGTVVIDEVAYVRTVTVEPWSEDAGDGAMAVDSEGAPVDEGETPQ